MTIKETITIEKGTESAKKFFNNEAKKEITKLEKENTKLKEKISILERKIYDQKNQIYRLNAKLSNLKSQLRLYITKMQTWQKLYKEVTKLNNSGWYLNQNTIKLLDSLRK